MMNRFPHVPNVAAAILAVLALGACSSEKGDDAASGTGEAAQSVQPRGSYDIDRETGETRARFTDNDGTTTTMRSGEKVPVRLPSGFTVYPDATITNNTRVEQADGLLVLINLETDAPLDELVGYYRNEADAAGIDVATSLQSGSAAKTGMAPASRSPLRGTGIPPGRNCPSGAASNESCRVARAALGARARTLSP